MTSSRHSAGWPVLVLASVVTAAVACTGDAPPSPSTLDQGEVAYRDGDFPTALEHFDRAHEDALAHGDSATAAVALTWIGLAHMQLGEYQRARSFGEEALAMKERLGLAERRAKSLNALGLLAWQEGRLDEARELHERSLRAARQVSDTSGIARAMNNLALVETDLGQLAAAGERYLEARELYRRLGRTEFEARVMTNVGALQAERGDALAAERALTEAFDLYAQAEDPVGEVNALGQLGVVYAAQGDPQRGLRYLDSALVVARELGLRAEEASNLEQLGNIHGNLGSYRLALNLFERADSINTELGLAYQHGANLRARSAIHRELGNREIAADLLERALSLHESMGASGEVLVDFLELAKVRQNEGLERDASRLLTAADSVAATHESERAQVEVALTRAELAEANGDPEAVLSALDAVASQAEAVSVDRQWRWWQLRARALFALGSPDAEVAARQAVERVERIRASLDSRLLRRSLTEGRASSYHLLAAILLADDRVEEAFEVADASRGGELVGQLSQRGTTLPSEELRQLAEMEELLITLGYVERRIDDWYGSTPPENRGSWFDAEIAALEAERERARLEYSRLLAERDRSSTPTRRILGDASITSREVRSELAAAEALIAFLSMSDELVVFVARPDRVWVHRREMTRGTLKSRLRVARALAGDPEADRGTIEAVFGALFDLLLQPAFGSGALDGVEELVIVPDAHLSYLPFAALFDRERGRYLVESHVLVDQPSAAAWLATRGRLTETSEVTAYSGAGFAPFPEELPASGEEVRHFIARHPGETYVGVQATESRLRDALASSAVVHAAAHGVMNARNPLFSRLELRVGSGTTDDDGALRVHELFSQQASAPLVFLSACETGAAPAWSPGVTGGADYTALSRGLLFAGVRSIVATLWPVQDAAAADFAERFYSELGQWSVATALARTQRALLADDGTSAPFFWAGYRVTGAGNFRLSPQDRGASPV